MQPEGLGGVLSASQLPLLSLMANACLSCTQLGIEPGLSVACIRMTCCMLPLTQRAFATRGACAWRSGGSHTRMRAPAWHDVCAVTSRHAGASACAFPSVRRDACDAARPGGESAESVQWRCYPWFPLPAYMVAHKQNVILEQCGQQAY